MILFMILISLKIRLVTLLTAQCEVRAWKPNIRLRNESYN